MRDDLLSFEDALRERGLRAALQILNSRTSHRFTGVFRFDAEMLRNLALVDKWLPGVEHGADLPLAQAYCAHLRSSGQPLQVVDGPENAGYGVVSYCGALVRDEGGEPWGALCHFDPKPCEAKDSDLPLLVAAAALIYKAAITVRAGDHVALNGTSPQARPR